MNGIGRGKDGEKKDKVAFITRETVGMVLLLFAGIAFFIAVTGQYVFGDVGVAINSFLVGLTGFLVYPLLLLVIFLSVSMVAGKKYVSVKWILRGTFFVLAVFFIVHTANSERFYNTGDYVGYGGYLRGCWKAAEDSVSGGTGGGVLLALIAYPVRYLLSQAGAYVLYSFLIALSVYVILLGTPLRKKISLSARKTEKPSAPREEETDGARAYPAPVAFEDLERARAAAPVDAPRPEPAREEAGSVPRVSLDDYSRSRDILFNSDPAESYRNNLIYHSDSYFNSRARSSSEKPAATDAPRYSEHYSEAAESERPVMPRRVTEDKPQETGGYSYTAQELNYPQTPSYRAEPAPQTPTYSEEPEYPQTPSYRAAEPEQPKEPVRDFYAHDVPAEEEADFDEPKREEAAEEPQPEDNVARARSFRDLFSRPVSTERTPITPAPEPPASEEPRIRDFGFRGLDRNPPATSQDEPQEQLNLFDSPIEDTGASRVYDAPLSRSSADLFNDDEVEDYREEEPAPVRDITRRRSAPAQPIPEEKAPTPAKHVYKPYVNPTADLFEQYNETVLVPDEEIQRNSDIIIDTLRSFGTTTEIVNVTCGSRVTRYDIDIPKNTTVNTVTKRSADLAMRLRKQGVNTYANLEHGVVSVEVPNDHPATVGMRSLLASPEFRNAKPTSLTFVLGKNIDGKCVCGDIEEMTHLLVAGTTGSGKSVCLHSMLTSMICKYSPEELRFILVDPKKTEFAVYENLPHLMINEIITDSQKVIMALNWAIQEMERRYDLFYQKTRMGTLVRKIDEYNEKLTEDEERLPKIVIVMDEFADLMSVARKDVEDRVVRLAQKARAAGLHLVLATQRPSANVVTGIIKSNLPTSIALSVKNELDSRIILDEGGAEKLLGRGDLMFTDKGKLTRVQGAFLTDDEIQNVVNYVKEHNEAYFDESVSDYLNKPTVAETDSDLYGEDGGSVDPQYIQALKIVVKLGQASISLIQRKCGVGYNHAGKIVEWMEAMGYIAPFEGKSKARDVLLTKEEFESKYGSLD